MQNIDYKKLLDITSDWVWAIDNNGLFTYCSENVINFTGYTAKETINKSPFNFVCDKHKRILHQSFSQ